jgi:ribosomal protein S27E
MSDIEKDIDQQIAHVMAFYGDKPDELFYKLRCLVLEWYMKGTAVKIHAHNQEKGTQIVCPHCKQGLTVYHLAWEAITCLHCREVIDRIRPV